MTQNFTGDPSARKYFAKAIRQHAAEVATSRDHAEHRCNGDEMLEGVPMSFTKGLEHDPGTLMVQDPNHFHLFRLAIAHGVVDYFTLSLPPHVLNGGGKRKWEAPTAGHVFSLQGPDPQSVTMPPPPRLGSQQLTYEIAEVYELALLRDVPFELFTDGALPAGTAPNDPGVQRIDDAVKRLNSLGYAAAGYPGEAGPPLAPDAPNQATRIAAGEPDDQGPEDIPARPRIPVPASGSPGQVSRGTVFRGSAPGVGTGPYLSQFLLMGNAVVGGPQQATDGHIAYGAQRIDQRVPRAEPVDFMMDEASYLSVQNGEDVPHADKQAFSGDHRFITTPRDMATYVHFDALYQAYLNACLILLGQKTPFDKGFDHLSGMGPYDKSGTGGFALWGGPHVLTLVTEVATRALKAVRFQKFNNHRRLRPEALAARIHKAGVIEPAGGPFTNMRNALDAAPDAATPSLLAAIGAHNQGQIGTATHLLPMAFKEGSPMHPAYGAGHATVAGACITILKAFFDTDCVLVRDADGEVGFRRDPDEELQPVRFVIDDTAADNGHGHKHKGKKGDSACEYPIADRLEVVDSDDRLTLEGELNKLAANISIGRNMAGVHYFTDYYDSLRMGEKIALGILEEQALCYTKDLFEMTVRAFDESAKPHVITSGGVPPFFS
ncbi:vanadium-dependent haloperoxidase [Alloyangia pacifica]|uniref:vanadium-dependent haloperoxidase n=1 Tax=Alloyangia pacifica TaxID=311180 RepID=UPI001CFEC7DD|nr:vanadium-dependent haloperoxidase [Alloyangia pacifica]